jgi:hypothetical protein
MPKNDPKGDRAACARRLSANPYKKPWLTVPNSRTCHSMARHQSIQLQAMEDRHPCFLGKSSKYIRFNKQKNGNFSTRCMHASDIRQMGFELFDPGNNSTWAYNHSFRKGAGPVIIYMIFHRDLQLTNCWVAIIIFIFHSQSCCWMVPRSSPSSLTHAHTYLFLV